MMIWQVRATEPGRDWLVNEYSDWDGKEKAKKLRKALARHAEERGLKLSFYVEFFAL